MKKVLVTALQPDPDGPVFGRVMDPEGFALAQDYSHDHTERIVKDLLVAGAANAQVAGFGAAVAGGLTVGVATGDVVDQNGVLYETESGDDSEVTMAAAHAGLPRIDLIVATLQIDVQTNEEFVPVRRLRTQAELEANLAPYPPTQENVATQLHTRAVISVKNGVPNAVPVAPVAGAGEVALWQVHVAAAQAVLAGGDLTDVRPLMKSLYEVTQQLGNLDISALVKKDGSVAFTGNQSMGGQRLTDLGNPVNPDDGVSLAILQAQLSGLGWKTNVRAATTANIALNGAQTIDGVNVVAPNRVLVKNQANFSANGIYVVAAGAWARAPDTDTWLKLVSAAVAIDEGATQQDTLWHCIADAGGVLGVTALNWSQFPVTIPLATNAVNGLMPSTDKAKLDAATDAATASALMKRDVNADAKVRRLVAGSDPGASDIGARLDVRQLTNDPDPLVIIYKHVQSNGFDTRALELRGHCNTPDANAYGVLNIVDAGSGTPGSPSGGEGRLLTLYGTNPAGTGPARVMEVRSSGRVSMKQLPTADPHNAGELWNDGSFVRVSAG